MRSFLSIILLIGIVAVCEHFRAQRNVYSFTETNAFFRETEAQTQLTPSPQKIEIKDLLSVPIEQGELENNTWPISQDKAVFLTNSSYPGHNGNIIIYAHNWPDLFGKLKDSDVGQIITVTTKDGAEWKYQIYLIDEVQADDTSALRPRSTEVLTLYTCSGVFDTKRLVVQAVPIF